MEWLKRTLSKTPTNNNNPNTPTQSNSSSSSSSEEERIYGITEEFINHMKSFTVDTFRNFPLQDEEEASSSNVRKDLSEWQERHAILILSRVKEISQLRYKLCPRHLKESQFWKIYFTLAWSHLAEYELRAIQQEKLKQMATEDVEKSLDNSPYEIEMADAKHGNFIEPHSSKALTFFGSLKNTDKCSVLDL